MYFSFIGLDKIYLLCGCIDLNALSYQCSWIVMWSKSVGFLFCEIENRIKKQKPTKQDKNRKEVLGLMWDKTTTTYHRKGPKSRSQTPAKREIKALGNDPANANSQISHTASDWKPASSAREAFKAEARRIDAVSGGVGSAANRNRIKSPGRKYIHQDGGTTVPWPKSS